jgi:hypothetical protein
MAWHQALSCEFVTAETWVCSCLRPFGICGGQSDSGTGFCLSELQFLPVSIILPTPHTHVSLTTIIAINLSKWQCCEIYHFSFPLSLLPPLPYRVFIKPLITTSNAYKLCPTFFWVEYDKRNRSLAHFLFNFPPWVNKTVNFLPWFGYIEFLEWPLTLKLITHKLRRFCTFFSLLGNVD